MHEVFLQRLSAHSVFRSDSHLKVFLEYDQDLCAKPRKKMDLFGGLVRNLSKTTDELYLGATVRDVNDFFENEMQFLTEYNAHLKEGSSRSERMAKKHKELADSYIKISSCLLQLSTNEQGSMEKFTAKTAEIFEKLRSMEGRVASDQDLKLVDTLKYYQRDSNAAKALLVRRLRCLATYEGANRNLEKARQKNKDVHAVSLYSLVHYISCSISTKFFTNMLSFTNWIKQPLEVQEVNYLVLKCFFICFLNVFNLLELYKIYMFLVFFELGYKSILK